MFYHLLIAAHVTACLLMILVVLLQTGRGAGLSVFGGASDSLINTPTGSSFMKNLTGALAGLFALTSLFLSLLSARIGMSSVTSKIPPPPPAAAGPAQAAPPTR